MTNAVRIQGQRECLCRTLWLFEQKGSTLRDHECLYKNSGNVKQKHFLIGNNVIGLIV